MVLICPWKSLKRHWNQEVSIKRWFSFINFRPLWGSNMNCVQGEIVWLVSLPLILVFKTTFYLNIHEKTKILAKVAHKLKQSLMYFFQSMSLLLYFLKEWWISMANINNIYFHFIKKGNFLIYYLKMVVSTFTVLR